MLWDVNKAIQYLRTHARSQSEGECARFTREAIEAGGITLRRDACAKDYGPSLTAAGFAEIPPAGPFHAGDVAVIQAICGHGSGHMCMFDGNIWISDFRQRSLYPGQAYRVEKPGYEIYRHP